MSFRSSSAFTENWKHFEYSEKDGVATVTFSRPEKLNALTFDVYADLRDLLGELPHRSDVKVLVITGAGRGFCSGGDVDAIIGELRNFDTKRLLEFTRMTGAVVEAMRRCPLPIIAAVNGTAAGAGAVIALASDLRIVAETAKFHFLFTKVGLSGGDMGSAYLLPRVVGLGRATEILMFGDPVDAQRALEIGLANQVVTDDELASATAELVERFTSGPSFAYATTKDLLAKEQDMDLAGAIELEAMTQALLMTSEDHAEFYDAFKEGRDPEWKGR
jgi:enoyl-CoA hydratase/carnithine racemase